MSIEEYAKTFISNYEQLERNCISLPILDSKFILESESFQKEVILHIEAHGFIVEEFWDSLGELTLKLIR